MTQSIGRYKLVGRLGHGGMAEIYLAKLRGPGGVEKSLVVKRIRKAVSRDPRFVNLFLREAKLSMSLAHKNIVPVFDFGRASGELFLVMEHVPGFDLGRAQAVATAKGEHLPPILTAYIGSEACQGLGSAHRKGAVHRDVTPRNILISSAGEVKLVDFGIAVGSGTIEDGKVRGTPSFMSPEQAEGGSIDERSDLFSLGLVLWQALAHEPPYRATEHKSVLDIARDGIVPPLPEDVPERLRQVIARATAREPSQRFENALQMQASLEEFIVAERSRGDDATPLGERLSNWMQSIGAGEPEADASFDVGLADDVVTFLDDGPDAVAKVVSGIETVIAPDNDESAETEAPPSAAPPRRHKWLPLAISGGMAVVALSAWGLSRTGKDGAITTSARAPRDAGVQKIAAADAAQVAPLDAAPIDAAAKPVDAAVARPAKVAADARKRATDNGTVQISSKPWARVTVAKRKESCEDTPCRLQLPEGSYVLHLENPVAGAKKSVTVKVRANQTSTVRVDLAPAQ